MSGCGNGGFPNLFPPGQQLPQTIGTPAPGSLTPQQIKANLADAQAQYHLLVTGQQASVFVDSNGERVQYTGANQADLYQYIQSLIAQLQPPPTNFCGGPYIPGPLQFIF